MRLISPTSLVPVLSVLTLALAFTACPKQSGPADPADPADPDPDDPDDPDDPVDPGGPSHFFLPTGDPDNTSAPRIALDPAGATHVVYPAFAGGGAYYAYCASDCRSDDDFAVVRFDTVGSVENAMIALDGTRPRVLVSGPTTVFYGSCDAGCGTASAWTFTPIYEHDGYRDVTGEAFALDPLGRPRFLIHTTVAYLGVGQRPPATDYMLCDADCHLAASWSALRMAGDQIWWQSSLAFDADGRARMATVVHKLGDATSSTIDLAAYVECTTGDCDEDAASWRGTVLMPAYVNDLAAVAIAPTVALALTSSGRPRIAVLGTDDEFQRILSYFACDEDVCQFPEAWSGSLLHYNEDLGAGLDLVLTSDDHPRIAYTVDYVIAMTACDDLECTDLDAAWKGTQIEAGHEMPPDAISFWEGCEVDAWFLHSPSLALDTAGHARVAYQARDIRARTGDPHDPNQPWCPAGTDMSWSRMTSL